MGAWIEIFVCMLVVSLLTSLLSWERGLKSEKTAERMKGLIVAPLVGAWIEIISDAVRGFGIASLLSWERGLKYVKGGLY